MKKFIITALLCTFVMDYARVWAQAETEPYGKLQKELGNTKAAKAFIARLKANDNLDINLGFSSGCIDLEYGKRIARTDAAKTVSLLAIQHIPMCDSIEIRRTYPTIADSMFACWKSKAANAVDVEFEDSIYIHEKHKNEYFVKGYFILNTGRLLLIMAESLIDTCKEMGIPSPIEIVINDSIGTIKRKY